MSKWPKYLLFLVAGYLTMTRSFAYIGVPQAKVFIGELSMAAIFFTRPAATVGRWMSALWDRSPLSEFAVALLCFIGYGWFEVVRGLSDGRAALLTLEGFGFHYYAICFFIGLWIGTVDRGLLRRMIRVVAWTNGIYGLLYIVYLNQILLTVPGTLDVPLLGQPAGSAIAILGLICLEPKLSRVWHLLTINMAVMLALQVRAEFLAFLVGVFAWSMLTRRFDRVLAGTAAVAILLTVALATDFKMAAPGTRGGQISTRAIIGRVLAPVDPDLAAEYTDDATSEAGTVAWRMVWWRSIWEDIHGDIGTALVGQGYGYRLADLVGYHERDLRTPHSVFFYALGYGGWIGVLLFITLQATLCRTLWSAARITGNTFGPVLWAAFVAGASFGNAFETPFGAIPFYILVGMAAAPLNLAVRQAYAYPASTYVLQTAGR